MSYVWSSSLSITIFHRAEFTFDSRIFWLSLKYWFGWLIPASQDELWTASNVKVHANCTSVVSVKISPQISTKKNYKKNVKLIQKIVLNTNLWPDNVGSALYPSHPPLHDCLLPFYLGRLSNSLHCRSITCYDEFNNGGQQSVNI